MQSTKKQSPERPPKKKALDQAIREADDLVDEASRQSFPASDAPAWSLPSKRKEK